MRFTAAYRNFLVTLQNTTRLKTYTKKKKRLFKLLKCAKV